MLKFLIVHLQNVLTFDAVKAIGQFYKHPTTADELATLTHHARNLDRVADHFSSESVLEVFEMLANAKSSYADFRKQILDELQLATAETTDNIILLNALEKCCKKLKHFKNQKDASQICRNIPALVHTVFLIWKTSVYYHKTKSFSSLLKETANFIVRIAQGFVGEETKDVINNPEKSHDMLRDALRICASFRGAYLDWKAKADVINEQRKRENAQKIAHQPRDDTLFNTKLFGQFEYRSNKPKDLKVHTQIEALAQYSPWPARNASCFDHINAFMERCNDLLELVQTTDHFRKLSDLADQGGTGSASLDALVADVFNAYVLATNEFFISVPNVLDIDSSRPFERYFYKLRLVVMELEDKLVTIMRAGFKQTANLSSRLCFTEIFGNISSRKRIRDALCEEFTAITNGLTNEINSAKDTFEGKSESGKCSKTEERIQKNVPSFVSQLRWNEALKDRLVGVFELTERVAPFIFEDDYGRSLRYQYQELLSKIVASKPNAEKHWTDQVIESLVNHLKKPVYVKTEILQNSILEEATEVLSINISQEQSVLLREMVCMANGGEHSLNQIPEIARSLPWKKIFEAATRLHVIAGTYNAIFSKASHLEMQLFNDNFESVLKLIAEGCTTICWNMDSLHDYIVSLSTVLTNDLWQRVLTVRSGFNEIIETSNLWQGLPLTVFAPGLEEFDIGDWQNRQVEKLQQISKYFCLLLSIFLHFIIFLIVFLTTEPKMFSTRWDSEFKILSNEFFDVLKLAEYLQLGLNVLTL